MTLVECRNEVRIVLIETLNFTSLAVRSVNDPVHVWPTNRTIPKQKCERLLVPEGNPPKQGRLTLPERDVRSIWKKWVLREKSMMVIDIVDFEKFCSTLSRLSGMTDESYYPKIKIWKTTGPSGQPTEIWASNSSGARLYVCLKKVSFCKQNE